MQACIPIAVPDFNKNFLADFTLQSKKKFSTYVVASGHQYGAEEGVFHYFFKVDIQLRLKDHIISRGKLH